jgi:hypothetical protein
MEHVASPLVGSMRTSGSWYLTLLLVSPILYSVVAAGAGIDADIGSMPAALVVFYLAAILGLIMWTLYRPTSVWDGWTRGWLMLGVVLWLYSTVMWSLQGEPVAGGSVLLPVTFLLVLLKRPGIPDVWRAGDAMAWAVVVSAAVILTLEVIGVIPSWYEVNGQAGRNLLPFDLSNYWLPLRESLGLDGRWGGYAGFPNIQGQAGALLIVFGFMRPGARRLAFVITGGVILLLTDSRTSYAAAAAGLVLVALLPGWRNADRSWPPARIIALLLGVLTGVRVALKVAADPNLTGRIAVWPDFLSLSSQNPVLGAGAPAIDEAVASGDLPGWAEQGHNILIDTFVRFGLVGLVLAIAFLGIALLVGVRGTRLGQGVGLAMAVALLVSCMGDLGLVWPYPTEGMSLLILSVLLAPRPSNSATVGGRTAAATTPIQ